jgi:pimeloyl-ACP methyl ester carboxylesterase
VDPADALPRQPRLERAGVDLPGHCKSEGEPPASVEEAADFVIALLDAAGVQKAALVGHSFGSLIALEAAARAPERVSHLALVGTAFPMKVSPALLDGALNDPQKAIAMVNTFSHSMMAPPPSSLGPGTWLHGSSRALMRRVLASNRDVNVFHIAASRPATTTPTAKRRWRRCSARCCSR